jgi:hypothetical protein
MQSAKFKTVKFLRPDINLMPGSLNFSQFVIDKCLKSTHFTKYLIIESVKFLLSFILNVCKYLAVHINLNDSSVKFGESRISNSVKFVKFLMHNLKKNI